MDVTCLIQKLDEMGVPKRFYTINGDCAPRRRAGSLAGEKPVCEGLTNQQ